MINIKETLYVVLDKVLMGRGIARKVNGFTIIFPTRYYKYYEPDYEKESFEFIRTQVKPGHTVLDIGGHLGLYAVAFAKLVQQSGSVYSFEPTPKTNNLLQKTIVLNNLQQVVKVQKEAISDKDGETIFYFSDHQADNSNSLVNYNKEKLVNGVKVPLVSIDSFSKRLQKKIDFIKIDVEGVELDAVLGARETMLHDRPVCILALHPYQVKSKGDSLEQIWDVVSGYRYELSYNGKKIDKTFFCAQEGLFDVWLKPLP